jgi:hypothetical protein
MTRYVVMTSNLCDYGTVIMSRRTGQILASPPLTLDSRDYDEWIMLNIDGYAVQVPNDYVPACLMAPAMWEQVDICLSRCRRLAPSS